MENENNKLSAQNISPNNADVPNKVIETYAEDMARVIENDQGGLIKKIIQEQSAKELEKKNFSPDSRQNKLYMIIGVALLLFALFALIFFIYKKDTISTVPIEKQFAPLIFNDKSFFIEIAGLSKDKIAESILTEVRETNLKKGGLEGIYLTQDKQIIGFRNFLNLLKSNFIPLDGTMISDNFLLGLINGENKDLFILMKIRSFTDIFENIKTWEGKMLYDLHAFFEIPINSNTSYLFTKDFEDGVVKNKNARILYDQNGQIMLMYVFVGDTSLVIADKIEAVSEVMFRLSNSQLKK